MTTNVQTAFENVHGGIRISLGECHRYQHAHIGNHVGRWISHCFPCWTLIWSGVHGYQARILDGAGSAVVVDRLPRSWAIHAPNVAFHERIPVPVPDCEQLYLFLSIAGTLPSLSERKTTIVLDCDDRLADLVRSMHRLQERDAPGDALAAHGLLLAVVGDILTCANDGGVGSDIDPWRLRSLDEARTVSSLLSIVDRHLACCLRSPLSRGQLAARLNVSVSSLAHRFRAETGMTLKQRIRWLRVREAKLRLAEPGATVKSVAYSLGFADAAYFSQIFKTVAGMSPQEFQGRCR